MFERLIGNVKGIFNRITIMELIISIIYVIIGLLFFTNASQSSIVVSIITGLLLIGSGISSIYSYIKREDIVLFDYNMIFGIILMISGFIALFLGKILNIIIGIYLLVCGIQKICYGLFLKKFHESSWLFTLVGGLFVIVIGIIAFITSKENVIVVTGICLLAYGLINFINTLLLRKRASYFIA